MSKTFKDSPKRKPQRSGSVRQRRISVRAVRRDPPDLRKLSRALIELAMAEARTEAQDRNTAEKNMEPEEPRD